ncbi:hypothetical protein Goarm_017227 [Gossypium armourianum]|uniref:Pectate lyase n=1 Tax=Gossypium armourianum TaxID=34283 RepID=A0A7J9JEP9_9ROSI|nr:hypothetical protein [Gossypium armourianum]
MAAHSYILFLFSLSFVVQIPTLQAHIAEYDNYWKARKLEAIENLNKAYHPNPEEVVHHYNDQFAKTMIKLNNTRRVLKGTKENGPCEITNPEGEFYVVTDPSDDILNPKPGTLRHAVIQRRPLWITFKRSMIITLEQELIITSNKTIDARGANVQIAKGAGITVQFVKNVIIHGLHIHHIITGTGGIIRDAEDHFGLRTASDGDGISLFGATNIWLDHLSVTNCSDGLIDVIQGSTAVTISNCHFTDHNEVLLFGASDSYTEDQKMQITVALNHFGKGLVERMPRCRHGFIHVVNNDYTHWLMYAIGGSRNPTIISQGNRYTASSTFASKEVTKRVFAPPEVWKKWNWISEGDHFENGAFFVSSGDPKASKKYGTNKMMPFNPGEMAPKLTKYAGTLNCKPGKPC